MIGESFSPLTLTIYLSVLTIYLSVLTIYLSVLMTIA